MRSGTPPTMGVQFGREYEDTVTGFRGVCTGTAQYIAGCDQVLLTPKTAPDGALREGHWFDDVRLVDETGQPVVRSSAVGGPVATAPTRSY